MYPQQQTMSQVSCSRRLGVVSVFIISTNTITIFRYESKNSPKAPPGRGRRLLTVLVVAEAALSVGYLTYIHVRGGAPGGDYGVAYDHQAGTHGR